MAKSKGQGKLDVLHIATAAGIYGAGCLALATVASMLGVPGFAEFTKLLTGFYGAYGYTVSPTGILIGGIWGFVEGFVHIGIFALIYNQLSRK